MTNQKPEPVQKNNITPSVRRSMNIRIRIILITMTAIGMYAGLAVVGPASSYAEEITRNVTSPRQVPSTLSKSLQTRLNDRRNKLLERLDLLNKKFDYFSQGVCTQGVEEGSAEDAYCQATYDRLNSKLDAFDADAKKFNLRIGLEEGKVLLLGYAFKMGDRMRAYAHQSLKSLKDVSRILIGVWNAERGSYEKARHLASLSNVNDDVLKELDDILLSLERKQQALLKKEIPRTVFSGKFNADFFNQYPINFSLSLVRAHTAIKSHDYDAALRQLAVARKMNIESPALADTELYVRQMKASAMEKKYPSNPALIKHQANMASAYAGWSLGMLLMDANMDAPAAVVLADSAKTLAREGNIEDSKTIFRLANTIPGRRETHGDGLPTSGIYDSASEPDIFFDALEYGNHDWNRSLQFLNIAHKAAPNNERISEAMAHVQAFMASEVK